MNSEELYYLNRIVGRWEQGISYAFELPLLRVRIRLSIDQLTEEVRSTSSEPVTKYVGNEIQEYDLRVDILAKIATVLKGKLQLIITYAFQW